MALETVGVRAVVEGIGPYERNAVKVQQAQQKMGASAAQAAQKSSFLGKALGQVAATASGFLVARGVMAIPQILGGIVSTSRDLELQMKKANIVFGDQIDVVNEWAKANAKAMGLSAAEATNLAARFGDLLIPMGFARKEAAEMSSEVVGLAGALSEWSGGQRSSAEVADILAKAMVGEREALKSLGIVITEADIKAKLAASGFTGLAGAQLQQARATATQTLLFEKSVDAQAAFAEGSGSAARKQAEMSAQMQEAKEAISLALTPALLSVTGVFATHVVPAVVAATGAIKKFIEVSGTVAAALKENRDLVIAFSTASLAIVLIPTVLKAVTALWELHGVLQTIATARHISILQATVQSLAMPAIGLPALAIGAVAAGLAIFGLTRHFMRSSEAADNLKRAQQALKEELEEVNRVARLAGMTEGEAQLKHFTDSFLENRRALSDQRTELEKQIVVLRELGGEAGPLSDQFQAQLEFVRELGGQYKELTVDQDALKEGAKDLTAETADWVAIAEKNGTSLEVLAELYPSLTDAAKELGTPLGDLEDSVPVVTQKFDDQITAVKDLAKAINDDLAAALRDLATPQTEEEVKLGALISGLEAQQSEIRATAALLNRDLTPAEEARVDVLDEEIDRFGDILTAVGDAKEAEGDRLAAQVGHFPTMERTNELVAGLLFLYGGAAAKAENLASWSAMVAEKIGAVAEEGTPLNDWLRNELIPDFEDATTAVRGLRDALEFQARRRAGPPVPTPPPGVGFQHGGIVPGPPGQPVLGLLHGGERVLPSAVAGMQPISVSVSAPVTMQDQMDWPAVRRAVHQEVDNALDSARSQSLRAGVPLRSEIG